MTPSDTSTDRQWSVWAGEKAVAAVSHVGRLDDEVKDLRVELRDISSQLKMMNENMMQILEIVASQQEEK